MNNAVRATLLRFLRLPPDPTPPAGAPGSVKVFRAGTNFFRLSLVGWAIAQAGALLGILFSITLLWQARRVIAEANASPPPAVAPASPATPAAPGEITPAAEPEKPRPRPKRRNSRERGTEVVRILGPHADSLLPVIVFFETLGIAIYLVQLVATLAALRLNYELRWYIVTDRSLRIRSGVWKVQEVTMSFANVQQVVVSQGPVQRLLGLADVRVQSAGGGSGASTHPHGSGPQDSMHTGVFQGVTNAAEIRNLIVERLRVFREAGLGDPDDAMPPPDSHGAAAGPAKDVSADVLAAAHEVLASVRALRATR